MTDPLFNPLPHGQLYIDRAKQRLIDRAARYGWAPTSRDPLVLERSDLAKQIVIEFNSGGIPKSCKWMNGDEFSSMTATGYVDLVALGEWFAWKPKEEGSDD